MKDWSRHLRVHDSVETKIKNYDFVTVLHRGPPFASITFFFLSPSILLSTVLLEKLVSPISTIEIFGFCFIHSTIATLSVDRSRPLTPLLAPILTPFYGVELRSTSSAFAGGTDTQSEIRAKNRCEVSQIIYELPFCKESTIFSFMVWRLESNGIDGMASPQGCKAFI